MQYINNANWFWTEMLETEGQLGKFKLNQMKNSYNHLE